MVIQAIELIFANVGANPPAFNQRSNGTKICLWSQADATNVDYAIGIDACSIWFRCLIRTQYQASTGLQELRGLQG